ncbi:MAG: 50S ribosomal protein L3 [bacterium]|nr:50S ribosomal protein L3 [bacterium]
MMEGLLGRKLGMTQIYATDGRVVPVTVVQAGPCLVVQRRTSENDGYEAVQLGLVDEKAPRSVPKPMQGHFGKAGVAAMRKLEEFRIEGEEEYKAGDQVKASIFTEEDYVDVIGTAKGKGFQGVMKRHGFGGGGATHGSMFHRAPGSIGQASDPSRVFPGIKLPGRMGGKPVTVKNLRVEKVDEEKNLIYLRGSVPGPRNGYISIRRAKKG